MGGALIEWAAQRGARVARLLVEDWNEPARLQVMQVGLRPVASMLRGSRTVGDAIAAAGRQWRASCPGARATDPRSLG